MSMLTSTVVVERAGPAVYAALAAHAPHERVRFQAELRAALAAASEDLDLRGVETVMARWHALASMAANPLTVEEQAALAGARKGDVAGLRARDPEGTWTTV